MDWDTWQKFYKRLCAAYGKTINGEQCATYYESLSQFSASIVEQAIRNLRETHKTWPTEPVLCEACRGVITSKPFERRKCDFCHGDGWVDAPDQTHHERVYTWYVERCPQCYPSHVA